MSILMQLVTWMICKRAKLEIVFSLKKCEVFCTQKAEVSFNTQIFCFVLCF